MRSKWVFTLCVMLVFGAFAPFVQTRNQQASAAAYQLLVSTSSSRSNPIALSGQSVSGNIHVFASPESPEITRVRFFLDDPKRAGKPHSVESNAPWDFAGGSVNVANAFDTASIADGSHTITAVIVLATGTNVVHSTFTVANSTVTPDPPVDPPVDPPADPPVDEVPSASGNKPAIINSYALKQGSHDWMRYQPRQFVNGATLNSENERVSDAGKYAGWDMLESPTTNRTVRRYAMDDWISIKLNRGAQVAIVWMDGDTPPGWLRAWPKVGTVTVAGKSKTVYQRSFGAQSFSLGNVWAPADKGASGLGPYARKPYVVLLAETAGQPSATPSVPSGQTLPAVGQTCPTWVHDAYRAKGPDGAFYPTWHAQIDPVYWCYFHHDHGTNPATFGNGSYTPLFGYAGLNYDMADMGGAHSGHSGHRMTENHHGFKVLVGDIDGTTEFLWTFHMGSQTLARYCARFHETNLAIWNGSEVVAELYTVADYGKAKVNVTGEAFRPTDCPEQADIVTGAGKGQTLGQRLLAIGNQGTPVIHYEGWRADIQHNYQVLGLSGESVTFWTNDGIAYCADVQCSKALYDTGNGDANHRVQDMYFSVADPGHSANGVYYTDARGNRLLAPSDDLAVRQYIKPGYKVTFDHAQIRKCIDLDGWGQQPTCHIGDAADLAEERESSLGPEFYPVVSYLK